MTAHHHATDLTQPSRLGRSLAEKDTMVGMNRQRVGLGAKKIPRAQTLSLLTPTFRCKAIVNTNEPRISCQKYIVSSSLLSLWH